MEIHERLKLLRKGYLKLTQEEFANRLGLKRSHITCMETGARHIIPRTILSVCREFNVNQEWLEHGTGEVFIDPVDKLDKSDEIKELTRMYLTLDDEDRSAFLAMLKAFQQKKGRD